MRLFPDVVEPALRQQLVAMNDGVEYMCRRIDVIQFSLEDTTDITTIVPLSQALLNITAYILGYWKVSQFLSVTNRVIVLVRKSKVHVVGIVSIVDDSKPSLATNFLTLFLKGTFLARLSSFR